MLASCAQAIQLTQVSIGLGPAQIGQTTKITARLAPRDVDEGTVTFTSDGAVIARCEAVTLSGGDALCETAFPRMGSYLIGVRYSGSAKFAPSSDSAVLSVGKLVPSVYVAVTPDSTVYGRGLDLNALVLGAEGVPKPSGTFTFVDLGVPLVNRPVVQATGKAALGMPLPVGDHVIVAMYNGDANYIARPSLPLKVTITMGPPVLAMSATPAQLAQPVLISASVNSPHPRGTITFEGFPLCDRLPLDSRGFAHCKTVYRQLGEYTATATYSGDTNLGPASATLKIVVGKAVAGLYAAHAPESPVYGEPVRINSLMLAAPELPAPSGPLVFTSDESPAHKGTAFLDTGGNASWPSTYPAGLRRVTVTYDGDANYAPAVTATTFIVRRAETATKLAAPSGGPFTATVTAVPPGSGTPTGSVRFLRDGQPLATVPLTAGSVTLQSSAAGVITAEYLGDNNFLASSSTASAGVPRALVLLTSDRNPGAYGTPVTFTAVVTPSPGTSLPLGSVQFSANGGPLGTVALVAGRASVTAPLAPGRHAILAAYSGDPVYESTSSTLTQVISGPQSGMVLSATVPSSVFGQPVVFQAQLASPGAGVVQFFDGQAPVGSAPLIDGAASLTVASLGVGSHTISVAWSGDALNGAATAELSHTVARAPTATLLTLGTGAATVRVAPVPPGAGTPSGTVRILKAQSNELLASATLVGGAATVVLPRAAGPLEAIYSGDANFVESASAAASAVTVVNAASYAGESVAPDEIVTLFGPFPEGLPSVQVTDRAGATRDAHILHSAPGQAAVVLPAGLPDGAATVSIGEWQALVTVARVAPGLFTADSSGKGPAAGIAGPIDIGENGASIVLYGTGIRHGAKATCTVAGQPLEVEYAGAQGEFHGLDQVNVLLPVALRGTGAAILQLKVDGVAANPVMLTMR
jgi:large repetitive protein